MLSTAEVSRAMCSHLPSNPLTGGFISGVADAGYSLSFLARILDGVSWHRDTRREGRASLQSTIKGIIVWRVLFPKVCCVGAEES